MKPRKPQSKVIGRLAIKRIMKTRNAEKAAENLFSGWSAMEKGNIKSGLSLYLHATTLYGAKFNAVIIELDAAKRKGFLPPNFPIPRNAKELEKLLKQLQEKNNKTS